MIFRVAKLNLSHSKTRSHNEGPRSPFLLVQVLFSSKCSSTNGFICSISVELLTIVVEFANYQSIQVAYVTSYTDTFRLKRHSTTEFKSF